MDKVEKNKMSNKFNELFVYYSFKDKEIKDVLNDFGISDVTVSFNSSDTASFRTLGKHDYINFLRAMGGLAALLEADYPEKFFEPYNGPMLNSGFISMFNTIGAYGNSKIPITEKGLIGFYSEEDEFGHPYFKNIKAKKYVKLEGHTLSYFINQLQASFGDFEKSGKLVTHIVLNKNTLSPFIFDPDFLNQVDLLHDNLFSQDNPVLGFLWGSILIHNNSLDKGDIYLEQSGNNLDKLYRYPYAA